MKQALWFWDLFYHCGCVLYGNQTKICVPEDRSPATEVSWPHQSAGQAHPPIDLTHVHTCTHIFISHQPPLSELGWNWGVHIWDALQAAKLNLTVTHSFHDNHCWKEKSLDVFKFQVMTVSVSSFVITTYSNSCDFYAKTLCILREEALGGVSLCTQASLLARFSSAGWEKLSGQTPPTDNAEASLQEVPVSQRDLLLAGRH